ncbi:MAG TPA: crossover junction endodeoxyribonuclease RuvC [Oculatellaceae cyanobacterium]
MVRDSQVLRILGIDPGTATTGYGVLDSWGKGRQESLRYIASGIISTPKDFTPGRRLCIIRQDLICLIEEFKPDVVALESLFFFKNATTAIPVAQARGVILEAAESCGVESFAYTPMQVKMHLTGFGKADKAMVQDMVQKLLDLPAIIKPDDAADAVAIAVCHARMSVTQPQPQPAPATTEAPKRAG